VLRERYNGHLLAAPPPKGEQSNVPAIARTPHQLKERGVRETHYKRPGRTVGDVGKALLGKGLQVPRLAGIPELASPREGSKRM